MGSNILTKAGNKPFKPKEFLKLATRLINDGKYDDICRSRTAIGRAYYSAFLYIKHRLEDGANPSVMIIKFIQKLLTL
jgi:hypothetical protein